MNVENDREKQIVQNFSQWKDISKFAPKIIPLSGGVTNFVCRIDLFSGEDPQADSSYIYKGIKPDVYTDRDREVKAMVLLSEKGFSPRLLFCASDGSFRIEEFIPGPVVISEMMFEENCVIKILWALAELHSVNPYFLNTEANFQNEYFSFGNLLKMAKNILAERQKHFSPDELAKINEMSFLFSEQEINWLRQLEKDLKGHPLVFSHNDICYENMILNSRNDKIMLFDWETCQRNYRGFDIGGIFNKRYFSYSSKTATGFLYAGRKEIEWPEILQSFHFYLIFREVVKFGEQNFDPLCLKNENLLENYSKKYFPFTENLKEEIEKLAKEYKYSSLLMNHNLISWAISMADFKNTGFDYVCFAYEKFREYLFFKKIFFGN